jgi:hypothetical protein
MMGDDTPQLESIEAVDEAPKSSAIHKPEDIASAFFSMEKPNLKKLLKEMSSKQLRRVIMNVASFPMIEPGDKLQTEYEKRAAYLFNEMVTNKTIIQLSYEMQRAEEAAKQLEQGVEENGKEEETDNR